MKVMLGKVLMTVLSAAIFTTSGAGQSSDTGDASNPLPPPMPEVMEISQGFNMAIVRDWEVEYDYEGNILLYAKVETGICSDLALSTLVMESYPPQYHFTLIETWNRFEVCAQVLEVKQVFIASIPGLVSSITLNGHKIDFLGSDGPQLPVPEDHDEVQN